MAPTRDALPRPSGSPGEKDRRELLRRTVVGAALIVLAVGDVWLGGVYFWALISLACLLMMGEWANLVKAGRARRRSQIIMLFPLFALVPAAPFPGAGMVTLSLFLFAAGAVWIIARSAGMAAGLLYVGAPALSLVYLRELDFGHLIAMWTLALVWATDIGAFFVGRAVGGPKLAPRISPNKTWAGLIGGVIAALLCGLILWSLDRLPLGFALASGGLAVVAQMGDLFESWLKRRAGVKDSGNILPGHGGVLDRLDGVVPVAPLVALLYAGGILA